MRHFSKDSPQDLSRNLFKDFSAISLRFLHGIRIEIPFVFSLRNPVRYSTRIFFRDSFKNFAEDSSRNSPRDFSQKLSFRRFLQRFLCGFFKNSSSVLLSNSSCDLSRKSHEFGKLLFGDYFSIEFTSDSQEIFLGMSHEFLS